MLGGLLEEETLSRRVGKTSRKELQGCGGRRSSRGRSGIGKGTGAETFPGGHLGNVRAGLGGSSLNSCFLGVPMEGG